MGIKYLLYLIAFHVFSLVQQLLIFFYSHKPRVLLWGTGSQYDLRYIQEHILHLKKVPSHLAIVVEDEILISELSNIICWCIGGGIQHITLYDMKGTLKQNITKLQQMIIEKSRAFFGTQYLGVLNLQWHTCNDYTNEISNHTNLQKLNTGLSLKFADNSCVYNASRINYNNNFNIYIASAFDGRREVVTLAHKCCTSIYNNRNKNTGAVIDQSYISSNIKGQSICTPEPDLILNFDSTKVMSGYMPWDIRLTEILYIGALEDVTLQGFIRGLYSYSKTERRHGV